MANMRRDMNSGGIVFDLTPEEKIMETTKKEILNLKEELENKNRELDKKLEEINNFLETTKK